MKRGRAEVIVNKVSTAVTSWPEFAAKANLSVGLRENREGPLPEFSRQLIWLLRYFELAIFLRSGD